MIGRLRGTLLTREAELVEIATSGGVVYEVEVPLSVAERLPRIGDEIELRTHYVVREDRAELYGFIDVAERTLFRRLISTQGVGAKLAVAMLSTYPAGRLARALSERDVATLVQVPGIGKRTAERLVVELSDKVDDIGLPDAETMGAEGAQAAVQALVALGLSFADADRGVREALAEGIDPLKTDELVRRALDR